MISIQIEELVNGYVVRVIGDAGYVLNEFVEDKNTIPRLIETKLAHILEETQ